MPNTYTLLETITVGAAGASSVTFNSIPQTGYTDLVVKASVRTDRAGTGGDGLNFTFNGSGGTAYSDKALRGDGASATSFSDTSAAVIYGTRADSAGNTANSFSSQDFYIPNYTSSNYKSVSIDGVTETNATTAYAELVAGLWSNTAAITSITIAGSVGTIQQYSTFTLYGVSALGTTPTKAPKATGGDTIMTDGTYWIHTFISSGTFKPATALTCDYLVVAGAGGGAGSRGGGGGAGGLRSTVTATGGGGSLESALSLAGGTGYTVTIGAGGAGATGNVTPGSSGSNSVLSTITSTGGGGGIPQNSVTNPTGGSGGGGSYNFAPGAGTANQGFAGGTGANVSSNVGAGGGGGAGAVGANGNGTTGVGGAGGAGVATSITGSSVTYAGGGGGGGNITGGAGSNGGGAGVISGTGVAGTANTGGGGGGNDQATGSGYGGAGGSGIVIIRYLAA